MNEAHVHMVVNHFPIIGMFLGVGILIVGLVLKNESVKRTAYVLFMVTALLGLAAMLTGEGAEEWVEDMPSVGKEIIHEHEEIAEKFAILLYLNGGVALLAFATSFMNHTKAKVFAIITLLLALGATVMAISVGNSGGEIRHTEIRANATHES